MIDPARLPAAHAALGELSPVLRRAAALDAGSLARIRVGGGHASVMLRLPFGVLVGRTIAAETAGEPIDVVVRAAEVLAWLDAVVPEPPVTRDGDWRGGLPPARGWRRVDTVPDDVIRGLVRSGARTLQQAAERAGVPGAQPRAEVADALLDSVVLTVSAAGGLHAEVTLRMVSALTRMGFLPRGSHAAVDVAGRWLRVAGEYGSVFAERGGLNLL